jgi:hypothetical protein
MPDSFESIRTWRGSRDRAFEELCYQLLREPEDLPPGMAAAPVRTGNPDGGVEWYTRTVAGEQWGWQAKYIKDIDNLLGAMTQTVQRVVQERPNLTKLTFCIPTNLSGGTAGGRQRPGDQRYQDRVVDWKRDIPGADKIEFVLLQESDLLDRLALPKHAGRRWFWWDEACFGPEWLANFLHRQAEVAGERYRPELQVDVPIQEDLAALGFADSFLSELREHTDHAVAQLKRVSEPASVLGRDTARAAEVVAKAAQEFTNVARLAQYRADDADPFADLDSTLNGCIAAVIDAQQQARQVEASLPEEKPGNGRSSVGELLRMHLGDLRRAGNALDGLRQFLDGSASRALRERFYFLAGSAGTGKTHLCLDSVQRALNEKRPALVLFGNRFGSGDLWAGICDQLGFPNVGAEKLLGALEAAAEACSPVARRFVFIVDALNDTRAEDYWASQLPALRASFAVRPLLSLLVTCRDTYLDHVDPEDRCQASIRSHPGFTGREFEATHKYFRHYKLQEPRVPLLLPEFTVPLFLVTYCEGLEGEGLNVPPAGHEGRVEVFERFLRVQLKRVTRRLNLAAASTRVQETLDVLIDEMARSGSEYVRFDRAEALTLASVPERTDWPRTALGALLSEGLLNQEWTYEEDNRFEAVRITYQAFSDFLILRRRLHDTPAGSAPDATFAQWLSRASWGVQEAAAVLLPERYGVELPDLLEPIIREQQTKDHHERWAQNRIDSLDAKVVDSFPYRRPQFITDRSIEILNRRINTHGGRRALYDVTLLCAPQPESPLNGDGLHRHLMRFPMPDRDANFGTELYHDLSGEGTALSRLARWAAEGPYPTYDAEIIRLASIPLVWMLSSPNRFARDWITKALVQLLAGHLDVVADLVEQFSTVNDPYVLERLVTVAYGSILRGGLAQQDQASQLARTIEQVIFARRSELIPDALMIDAARGIIEWAVAHELLPPASLTVARPPYGFRRPGNPPTQERLDDLYPHGKGTTDQTSYGSIYISVLSMGDFGRYVIESGMRYFLRISLEKPRPESNPPAKPRFLRSRWKLFVASLSSKQRKQIESLFGPLLAEGEKERPGLIALTNLWSLLSKKQLKLLDDCWRQPRRRPRQDWTYPTDRAQRWVYHRTMTLGWTPQLFGPFDRYLHFQTGDRSSHKYERFGKKYQWIAYHELLARVADNYHFSNWYSDETDTFEGIYQLNDREIDPSLPPVPYREFEQRIFKRGTWPPLDIDFPQTLPVSVDFESYGTDYNAFLGDHATLPRPESVVRVLDDDGNSWLILDAYVSERLRSSDDANREENAQFYSLVSSIVKCDQIDQVVAAFPRELRNDPIHLAFIHSSGHTDCCYVGELGWRNTSCPHRHADELLLIDQPPSSFMGYVTVEKYLWEGNVWDCSIEDSARMVLPSTFLQQSAGLEWSRTTRSWLANDEIVVCNVEVALQHGRGTLLLVRNSWLTKFLDDRDMALLYGVRGQREHRGPGEREFRWLEFEFSGTYNSGELIPGHSEIRTRTNQSKLK